MYGTSQLKQIIGQTLVSVQGMHPGSEEVTLTSETGNVLVLRYEQDCCASCSVCQIDGDAADLLGTPLVMAELVSNDEPAPGEYESFTWTFVKFATVRGYVTLRWYGSSNGYYSEAPTAFYNDKSSYE